MATLVRRVYHRLRTIGRGPVDKFNNRETYARLINDLKATHDADEALKLAIGGEFKAVGTLELELLRYFGLKEDAYVIDIGCGAGRLAQALSPFLKGKYLGIDIIPELVEHSRRVAGRADWRFEVAEGLRIPERNETADVVCFFSVFTHLLHEQSYVYLQEAKRVLKPGGQIVFSFVDFAVPAHWGAFELHVNDLAANKYPLHMFISKDAIYAWAEHLGLEVQAIEDGDKSFIPLSSPVTLEDGRVMKQAGTIGQSVCVLQKAS